MSSWNEGVEKWDAFLDEATHSVHDAWVASGRRELTTYELYELNDVLTAFFQDKS